MNALDVSPRRHVPDEMLAAHAAGALPYPFAVLIAEHVSWCDECRARLEAHQILGGVMLEGLAGAPLSAGARARALAALDRPAPARPRPAPFDVFPGPIAEVLGGRPPRWRAIGPGTKQAILWRGAEGSLRLLSIPAGQAVPDHGHRGLELTLVLSGSFSDESGEFRAGDLEVADESVEHVPTAGPEGPCVCAAATDAPLRFRSLIPRLAQPFLRI